MSALKRSGHFLLYSLLVFCSPTSVLSVNYLEHFCPNSTTYAPNSAYRSNLNQLLHTLTSNAYSDNGFFNYTVGLGSLDTIYGLFLCRGDVNTDVCRQCVANATSEVLQRCPVEKMATIWYDECILRYSSQSMFSTVEQSVVFVKFDERNISGDTYNFIYELVDATNKTIEQAANKFSGKKFATSEANLESSQRVYTLAQCMPYLSSEDCYTCLRGYISRIPTCCAFKSGARVLSPTCFYRYELYLFYSRTAITSQVPNNKQGKGGIARHVIIAIVVPVVIIFSVLLLVGLCLLKKKYYVTLEQGNEGSEILTVETLQYDLNTVQLSTNNFSFENKIGEGGFGDVYKGTFPSGQEIAVKRLSTSSRQGAEEFKNEVVLAAKLQHRNLVRLLGFCLEREEKILIYEFLLNKSLDNFIFKNQQLLDWPRRYKIIEGIARGLLYLHKDSRLKIIHRDLKASNILLDGDMNPKISDFGMARIFEVEQSQENTLRVVGTYGYMAPEYAMHGQFSIKSDVFSFGVLILEIISGKKNNSFYKSDGRRGLVSYAWELWRNSTPLELMDPTLQDSYVSDEVVRCIQIGLLCIEEDVDKRPIMSSILSMLESYSTSLPVPHRPAFYILNRVDNTNQPQSISINEASISEMCPR